MGTSNSNRGARGSTALIPTWLNVPDSGAAPVPNNPPNEGDENNNDNQNEVPSPPAPRPEPQPADVDRYRTARSNFTRFVRSGGTDRRSLGRSVSSYVSRSVGGARNATMRMGSSRRTTSTLLSFFASVQTRGVETTLRGLDLGDLAGQEISEIFIRLVDYFCPDGGNIDEGIARSAFIETIAELADAGIQDFDTLNAAQMQTIVEIFTTNAIEQRLYNDIGTKICLSAENVASFENVQEILHDFIQGSVSDALTGVALDFTSITQENVNVIVDNIYQTSYSILEQLAENEQL